MSKKFGVSYNLFDGEELLEKSILSIRDSVDYISVVYQTISNTNQVTEIDLESLLNDLKSRKLIDEIVFFEPKQNLSPHVNEITKRNIGYLKSMKNWCDYHMAMDTDEFYTKDQLEYIKRKYIEDNLDSAYCQMQTYYKYPNLVLDPPEDYYVSLFYKIGNNRNYYLGCDSPVTVDPTRRMLSGNFSIFTRDEIEMHHMSYVRNDISKKFSSSSAAGNFKDVEFVVDYFNKFDGTQDALMLGTEHKYYKTRYVKNLFKV